MTVKMKEVKKLPPNLVNCFDIILQFVLFVIFINDIDLAMEVTGSFLFKFADDTKVGMVVETEEQRGEQM